LAYRNEEKFKSLPASERDALMGKVMPVDAEFKKDKRVTMNAGLQWGTATTLRLREGKLMVTDGPFLETKEVVGGVFLIEAKDLNEAIAVAKGHPAAQFGDGLGFAIEVRPVNSFTNG
jgi:hypothetical protein